MQVGEENELGDAIVRIGDGSKGVGGHGPDTLTRGADNN